jgi:uncharacterized protein (TIRG00374 family)
MENKGTMLKYVKITVSLLLIGLLLYNVEWNLVLDNLKAMHGWAVALAFVILTIQFPISTIKWRQSLEVHELNYPFWFLQKVLCIGFFFNNFLPTSIGGDAYRVIRTMPGDGYRSRAVSAVLVERIIGLAALLFLGFLGGVAVMGGERTDIAVYYVSICSAGGVVLLFLYLLFKTQYVAGMLTRISRLKMVDILIHNVNLIKKSPGLLCNIIFVSLIFQVLAILAISVLFEALGADGGYAKYALISAIVGVAGVIPISINGIGVIEGAFAVSAIQLGMDYNQAVIVAFTLRILVVPLSLLCGLIYLLDTRKPAV